ncbi:hypothetical protein V6N13_140430 [Hibiscus sabdariffa]
MESHGIPYNHYNSMSVLSFVDSCYRKDTQLSSYEHHISPIGGVNQWTIVEGMESILSPVLKGPVGRQKKKRLERDEVPTAEKAKINPPTTSQLEFYRAKSTSSKPAFYSAKPTSFGYDTKVDDVYTKKVLSPTHQHKPLLYMIE